MKLPDGSTVEREVPSWEADMLLTALDLPQLADMRGLVLEVVGDFRS